MNYRTLRLTHRWTALAVTVPLALYFVSGVRLAHRTWWPAKPAVSSRRVQAPPAEGRELAQALMASGVVRGELRSVRTNEGNTTLRIDRPGVSHQVKCSGSTCEVMTTDAGFGGLIDGLHQSGGFGFGYGPLNLWGGVAALVSVGLIVLGATGIYLWFANRRERRAGVILLTAGLLLPAILIISMRN